MSLWSTIATIAGGVIGAAFGGPVGGALGAGLGALGGSLARDEDNAAYRQSINDTNAANLAIANQNNKTAIKLMQEQNAFNTQMYHVNNAYNDPSMQVMRLRNAGINPSTLVGNTPATQVQAVSTPSLSTPTMRAPQYLESGFRNFGVEFSGHMRDYLANSMSGEKLKQERYNTHIADVTSRNVQERQRLELLELYSRIDSMKLSDAVKLKEKQRIERELNFLARTEEERIRGVKLENDKTTQDIASSKESVERAKEESRRQDTKVRIEEILANSKVKVDKATIAQLDKLCEKLQNEILMSDEDLAIKKNDRKASDRRKEFNLFMLDNFGNTTEETQAMALAATALRQSKDEESVPQLIRQISRYLGLSKAVSDAAMAVALKK